MLKHMLTHSTKDHRRGEADHQQYQQQQLPIMEGDNTLSSPILDPRMTREERLRKDLSSISSRPVSVHGNIIHNHSIYANTVPVAKMNGGHNISSSAPTSSNRLNSSVNGNLNLSTNLNSSSSPGTTNGTRTTLMDSSREHSHHDLNSTQISPISRTASNAAPQTQGRRHSRPRHYQRSNQSHLHNSTMHQNGGLNITNGMGRRLNATLLPANVSKFMIKSKEAGVHEIITSLGLLCVASLLLALLAFVFLMKISPVTSKRLDSIQDQPEGDGVRVTIYEVTVAMCALALSLNLCCLLVCSIQFLFAVKLVKSSQGKARTTKYLKEASMTRTCAITGFFISIPVFLTGLILYTFLHFGDTPAIISSIFIGLGIVFCAAAVVHNVFVWQREKMNSHLPSTQILEKNEILNRTAKSHGLDLPQATLDLSGPNATIVSTQGLELSTLV